MSCTYTWRGRASRSTLSAHPTPERLREMQEVFSRQTERSIAAVYRRAAQREGK